MFKPNTEQRKVINCDASKIVVVAGAGSGKTASLVHRVNRLVNDGEDPESILVLTFTRAAAFEMRERYILITDNKINIPEFKTFHAFCYSLISNDAQVLKAIGYKSVPSVVENGEDKKYKQMAKVKSGTKLSDKKLATGEGLSLKETREYRIYKKILQQLICDANLITFDDLFAKVCDLFKADDPCIMKYKNRYKHLIIDEFQDTDPKQWEFAQSIPDCNICVIGDALQALYSFRGADSELIKSLTDNPEWVKINLSYNYRSGKNIVNFANANTLYAAGRPYRNIMQANNAFDGQVDVSYLDMRKNTYGGSSLQSIECMYLEQLQDNPLPGTTALLCRSNAEVAAVCDVLTDIGVQYTTTGTNSDKLHYVKCITDNDYMINWTATLLTSASYASYLKMLKLRESSKEELKESTTQWFYKHIATSLMRERMDKVFQLRTILNDKSITPAQRIIDCLSVLDTDYLIDYDQTFESMKDAIDYIREVLENEENKDCSIYVGTIHSSKGLEYDNVVLFGVNDSSFKLQGEENFNVYYVGITRAKKTLKIFKYEE